MIPYFWTFRFVYNVTGASLVAELEKNLSAMQETWVRFLGWEEGSGNPPQYSCLENLMDRGAWWTIVHRVARDGHNLATKPPPQCYYANNSLIKNSAVTGLPWWPSG